MGPEHRWRTATAVIAALSIGIGADYASHITHRFTALTTAPAFHRWQADMDR